MLLKMKPVEPMRTSSVPRTSDPSYCSSLNWPSESGMWGSQVTPAQGERKVGFLRSLGGSKFQCLPGGEGPPGAVVACLTF